MTKPCPYCGVIHAPTCIPEAQEWMQECFDILAATGQDVSNIGPQHLDHGEALGEVKLMRQRYDLMADTLIDISEGKIGKAGNTGSSCSGGREMPAESRCLRFVRGGREVSFGGSSPLMSAWRELRTAMWRSRHLHTWEDHPKRREYLMANDGRGMCNTGARAPGACVLGGIGCDVDHKRIMEGVDQ